jgi:hypothetical protein
MRDRSVSIHSVHAITSPEARSQKPQPEPAEARTNTALLG